MSFVFRGTRGDIENGFPEFIPERRAMVSFLCIVFCVRLLLLASILIVVVFYVSVFIQRALSIPTRLLFSLQVLIYWFCSLSCDFDRFVIC